MTAALRIEQLTVHYGQLPALREISLSVDPGETLAVVGANGAGKTTLLRSIAGQLTPTSGRIFFEGEDITKAPPHVRVRRGVAMVPEGRRLFGSLTGDENLRVSLSARRSGTWTLASVYEAFPLVARLRNRRAHAMSGGERQAVAIARALLTNPKLLLLDEVSLGLAPLVVAEVYATLPTILASGTAVLVVEQDVVQASAVADEVHCLLQGQTSLSGRGFSMAEISAAYFGYEEVAP